MFYFQGCWLLGKPSRSIYFSLVRSVKLNPTPNIPAFSEDWKIFSHRKNNAYILLNGYFEKGKVGVFVQSQRRVWMDHMNIENDYFMPNFINSVLINSHLFIATWSKVFFSEWVDLFCICPLHPTNLVNLYYTWEICD